MPTGESQSSATPPVRFFNDLVEQVQVEFNRLAQEAGIKGARIEVQRVVPDDYGKVIREAKACLRKGMAKAA